MTSVKVREDSYLPMEAYTKANGLTRNITEKEGSFTPMANITKANLRTTRRTGLESTMGRMAQSMWENGKMNCSRERERRKYRIIHIIVVISTKE